MGSALPPRLKLEAELVEIDENLNRNELTAAQRAASIKRRKEIWEVLHPGSSGGTSCPTGRKSDGKFGDGQQQFAADTATKTGESKRDINRHVARAEALGPDIHAVIGTSLDKGVELDALKELPREQAKKRQAATQIDGGKAPVRTDHAAPEANGRARDMDPPEQGRP